MAQIKYRVNRGVFSAFYKGIRIQGYGVGSTGYFCVSVFIMLPEQADILIYGRMSKDIDELLDDVDNLVDAVCKWTEFSINAPEDDETLTDRGMLKSEMAYRWR